jgi:RNA polymerase sigma-B factor
MRDPNALRPSGTVSADFEELSDSDLLTSCREYPRGSREQAAACDVLVRRYTPLVRASVRQYRESPESLEELMQVGFVGLLKAIGNYDPAFGNGLRAYAAPCITGEIKRHFRDKRWQVRATRPVQELMLELRGVHEDLTHELGRLPFESELAGRLGVTPDELREARRAVEGFSALSLNAPAGEADGAAELGDLLGDVDDGFERTVDMEAVTRHWHELARPEQQVLILRYFGNLTQEEVAARLGVSQMHVSRLQARALARLRARLLPPPGIATARPILGR